MKGASGGRAGIQQRRQEKGAGLVRKRARLGSGDGSEGEGEDHEGEGEGEGEGESDSPRRDKGELGRRVSKKGQGESRETEHRVSGGWLIQAESLRRNSLGCAPKFQRQPGSTALCEDSGVFSKQPSLLNVLESACVRIRGQRGGMSQVGGVGVGNDESHQAQESRRENEDTRGARGINEGA